MPRDDVERYFIQGLPCEVLGLRLMLDAKKGQDLFPERREKPRVFVVEPGPLSALLGIPDIRPGDGLMSIGGDLAGFREQYIESLPSFINALVEMYAPGLPARFSWIYGPKAHFPFGAVRRSFITVPEAELAALAGLRDKLAAYARAHRLAWTAPRRHFRCGWYNAHLWLCKLRLLGTFSSRVPVSILPVHEQYWILLLRLLSRHAPCVLNIRRKDPASLAFASPSISAPALTQIAQALCTRQLGSAAQLFKLARQWDLDEFSVKFKNYVLDVKPLTPDGIRVSLTPITGKRRWHI